VRDLILSQCSATLFGQPWAILPEKLSALVDVLDRRRGGLEATAADLDRIQAANDARERMGPPGASVRDVRGMPVRQFGRVAVVPMIGVVTQRPSIYTKYSGGVSAEQFAAVNEELAADSSVAAIVWDVDSPGGSVGGVPEAADRLYALRGQKRVVAVANPVMASAAYWLASAADEVVSSPSSLTGSIGVIAAHEDYSSANDRAGVRVTYVYAGKRKADGNPDSPLTDDARAAMKQRVDDYYGMFLAAVARHRKSTPAAVRDGYGEGDVLTSKRAVAAGLADRVETLGQVLARLGAKFDPPPAAKGINSALAAAVQRQAEAAR